jgi:hypothetical protein
LGLWREDAAAAADEVDLDGKLQAAPLLGDMNGAWALEAAGARSRAAREKVRKHEAKAHPDLFRE